MKIVICNKHDYSTEISDHIDQSILLMQSMMTAEV